MGDHVSQGDYLDVTQNSQVSSLKQICFQYYAYNVSDKLSEERQIHSINVLKLSTRCLNLTRTVTGDSTPGLQYK